VQVGPKGSFQASTQGMATLRKYGNKTHSSTTTKGPWQNVSNRYLGLKFYIHGQAHYGWARLNVTVTNYGIYALLTGYAYETIANKAIVTGKTKGGQTVSRPAGLSQHESSTATLGVLAQGASNLAVWRERSTAEK